jgi:hypothetical protein
MQAVIQPAGRCTCPGSSGDGVYERFIQCYFQDILCKLSWQRGKGVKSQIANPKSQTNQNDSKSNIQTIKSTEEIINHKRPFYRRIAEISIDFMLLEIKNHISLLNR